jgi:acetyltransferase-like isoleucine patch superfamily enzyme
MLSKVYRKIIYKIELLFSFFRKLHLKLMYPNIEIDSRTFISKRCSISCSNNAKLKITESYLSKGVVIKSDNVAAISINKTFIGINSVIVATKGITIKQDCLIAEMVVIRDQDHILKKGVSITNSGLKDDFIVINENVWLAAKCTILRGSEIESGVVVGANSVVKGKLEANTVYAGIPSQKIYTY